MRSILITALFLLPTLVSAQAWNKVNNPSIMQSDFVARLESLPLNGQVKDSRLAWPGFHWLNYLGN
ncbi:MAG: hypothetical protein K2P81_12935, partial [Bacteriovoracaceae bacterium]|nr:hypothetical protein [Bacteriovoracaceae bacterium]